jgi:Ca2+-binding EF-hand superfamily protein
MKPKMHPRIVSTAIVVAASCLVFLAPSPSAAQPAGSERLTEEDVKRGFETTDVNHDGKIDPSEAEKNEGLRGAGRFAKCDLDGNGTLDLDEYREETTVIALRASKSVDPLVISKVEESRKADARVFLSDDAFSSLDVDAGGTLTLDEIATKVPTRRKNLEAWVAPAFNAADANRDTKLSKEEFDAFAKAIRDWTKVTAPPPTASPVKSREPEKEKPRGAR